LILLVIVVLFTCQLPSFLSLPTIYLIEEIFVMKPNSLKATHYCRCIGMKEIMEGMVSG